MGQGPILDAIDAGHIERTPAKGQKPYCGECKTQWPCDEIKAARSKQAKYAENLRLHALVARETRRTYV